MKTNIITLGTLLLMAASGPALLAQAQDDVLARLAARRAAEAAGGDAGAAAQPAATPTPTTDATAAPATVAPATAPTAAAADAASTNATAAAVDDDEVRRRAAIAAALKEAETNAANMPTNLAANLQIIIRRNIFDPNRRPYDAVVRTPAPIPVRVETFYLTGTSEKIGMGPVAFFSGSGVPTYPPTRCVGDMINGFKIKAINFDGVKLVDNVAGSTNAEFDLQPTKGLTRNDGGPWRMAYSEVSYAPVAPRQARMDGSDSVQQYQAPLMAQSFSAPTMSFSLGETSFPDDTGGFGNNNNNGGRRGRRNNNNNNNFGDTTGNGGFGNGGGGGGGGGRTRGGNGGGFGNNAFAPAQPAAPAAPADPAVLARLAARRAAEQ